MACVIYRSRRFAYFGALNSLFCERCCIFGNYINRLLGVWALFIALFQILRMITRERLLAMWLFDSHFNFQTWPACDVTMALIIRRTIDHFHYDVTRAEVSGSCSKDRAQCRAIARKCQKNHQKRHVGQGKLPGVSQSNVLMCPIAIQIQRNSAWNCEECC